MHENSHPFLGVRLQSSKKCYAGSYVFYSDSHIHCTLLGSRCHESKAASISVVVMLQCVIHHIKSTFYDNPIKKRSGASFHRFLASMGSNALLNDRINLFRLVLSKVHFHKVLEKRVIVQLQLVFYRHLLDRCVNRHTIVSGNGLDS